MIPTVGDDSWGVHRLGHAGSPHTLRGRRNAYAVRVGSIVRRVHAFTAWERIIYLAERAAASLLERAQKQLALPAGMPCRTTQPLVKLPLRQTPGHRAAVQIEQLHVSP